MSANTCPTKIQEPFPSISSAPCIDASFRGLFFERKILVASQRKSTRWVNLSKAPEKRFLNGNDNSSWRGGQ